MTDNERLGKIWEFVSGKIAEVDAEIEMKDEEYDWGAKAAFFSVLDFMKGLMD